MQAHLGVTVNQRQEVIEIVIPGERIGRTAVPQQLMKAQCRQGQKQAGKP